MVLEPGCSPGLQKPNADQIWFLLNVKTIQHSLTHQCIHWSAFVAACWWIATDRFSLIFQSNNYQECSCSLEMVSHRFDFVKFVSPCFGVVMFLVFTKSGVLLDVRLPPQYHVGSGWCVFFTLYFFAFWPKDSILVSYEQSTFSTCFRFHY